MNQAPRFAQKQITRLVLATLLVGGSQLALAADAIDLGTVGAQGAGSAPLPAAAKKAPSQGSLTARSAQSEISEEFVRDFTPPSGNFTDAIQMAPGMFSYSQNGPGLGDTKSYFRGFSDGNYTIAFDGIPFQDTNSPTHHSWAFFPGPFIGGAVIDRSPGSAATLGPANFGGSINLLSRNLEADKRISATAAYGTWNTKLLGAEYETGQFGEEGASNLLLNVHELKSDGYQTYNKQDREGFSAKYQHALSADTAITAFASWIDLHTNTPNTKGPTRAQVALYGNNYLMSGDPTKADYYGYNFYHVRSDFEYLGFNTVLGDGWKLEDKVYTYSYHNQQNYNGTTISATSATDKLNSYNTNGNILRLSKEGQQGIFRTGLWTEIPDTDRYQIPSDPRTWKDAALPNFHEKFKTYLVQPYAEYEWKATPQLKVTPGVKYSYYKQDFEQFADNGKTVGNLGGAASIKHTAKYTSVLPSLDLHYQIQSNWTAYAQYATGDTIPLTNVFDVKNASVKTQPDPTRSKTYQAGTVWKSDRYTLDVDAYYIKFDNAYSSTTDAAGNTNWFAQGKSTTQGIEAESNIILGQGFSLYLNATVGSAKYDATGKWVASAPRDTETLGLTYEHAGWNSAVFAKRVGKMFNDAADGTNEASPIDAFVMTNLYVNYTAKLNDSFAKKAKVQLSVNNLFDKHSIVGVNTATGKSFGAAADTLTIVAGRSANLSATVDF